MESLTENGMEVDETSPGVSVFVDLGSDLDVHVEGVGDVFHHDEEVGDGEAGEDGVGGAGHLAAGEHRDVDGVGGGADDADDQRDVAVQAAVGAVEVGGAGHAVRVCGVRHARGPLSLCWWSSAVENCQHHLDIKPSHNTRHRHNLKQIIVSQYSDNSN